jgi:hypothetical protein
MWKQTLAVLAVTSAALQAGSLEGFSRVARGAAEQLAVSAGTPSTATGDHTNVAMYIWAERYVYRPGEQLTLKMTVKTNDPYPYTIVAFRQNNQTGKKTYYTANQASETAIDIYGKSYEDGFQPVRVADQTRATVIGEGGWLVGSPLAIPNELGMHTLCVELRDYTGSRVLKAAYFKIGVVDEVVNIGGVLTGEINWVNTKAYKIDSLTRVENGTLNIQPGTIVLGGPRVDDPTALIITPSAKINAQGTR